MSALHELAMFKSAHCSFVYGRTRGRLARLLRAAPRRVVPVTEDAAVPAASVPPREPPAKQGQPPRTADDEREEAEARRLKLREKYRADDDSKYDNPPGSSLLAMGSCPRKRPVLFFFSVEIQGVKFASVRLAFSYKFYFILFVHTGALHGCLQVCLHE
ncbi:uncharacterized protein LOC144168894 isoform X1 [Haemaphysalis longicornis]